MPFPWEQLIQSGVQVGTQLAASAKLSSAQKKEAGRQFDILDKQVASLYSSLLNQSTITEAQLNGARQAFEQLAGFANQYGSVEYVASQWQGEGPRQATLLRLIEGKAAPVAQPGATVTETVVMPDGSIASVVPAAAGSSQTTTIVLVAALIAGALILKR